MNDESLSKLGPYRIESRLGSGGMGTVYLARVVERNPAVPLGKFVALKVLHDHLLGRRAAIERFLREGRIGCRVRHRSLVRTLDVSSYPHDGRSIHVLVMEFVEGRTARSLLRDGTRPSESFCRRVLREVTETLAVIHEAGVVHRDVKPENLLLTPEGKVMLSDLGIAQVVDEAVRLSTTGAFLGTVLYAAPEQFRGGRTPVDGRADLFSLGLTVYELATGNQPFHSDDLRESMTLHLRANIPHPCEVNQEITPFFGEVLNTLISEDPEDRFTSAEELIRVLEEGETGEWWTAQSAKSRRGLLRSAASTQAAHDPDCLTPEDEEILGVACCCGRDFESSVLAEALGRSRHSIADHLARPGIVQLDDAHYRFDSRRDRERLYRGLPRALRQLYHLAIARAIASLRESSGGDRKSSDGADEFALCQQLYAAGRAEEAERFLPQALQIH